MTLVLLAGRARSPCSWCPASGGRERTCADSSCWLSRWHQRLGRGHQCSASQRRCPRGRISLPWGCCQHLCPRALRGAPTSLEAPQDQQGHLTPAPADCHPAPGLPSLDKQSLFPQPSSSPERKPDILGAHFPGAGTPS